MSKTISILLINIFFICGVWSNTLKSTSLKAENGKLFVGSGLTPGGFTKEVEVIDVSDSGLTCNNLQDFILETLSPIGGRFYNGNQPLVCGGHSATTFFKDCYVLLSDGIWDYAEQMNSLRAYTAATAVGDQVYVAGGYTGTEFLDSVEVYTQGGGGWDANYPPVPTTVYQHCMVQLDEENLILIGGIQGSEYSAKTYIYNLVFQTWFEGPSLNAARSRHSCAKVRREAGSSEFDIVVAGGYDGGYLNSVEILRVDQTAWEFGPELPLNLCCTGAAVDESGAMILVGGYSSEEKHLNTLYKLPTIADGWTELPQKLKTARNYPATFFIPDELTSCTANRI